VLSDEGGGLCTGRVVALVCSGSFCSRAGVGFGGVGGLAVLGNTARQIRVGRGRRSAAGGHSGSFCIQL